MAGRFLERWRDRGAVVGGAGAVLEEVATAVRCLFIFLGGELGCEGSSDSSCGLPRRVVALRFLETVLPVGGVPVVSALFKAFSARAAERVLGGIEATLDDGA
jgi:hypothetical protein